MAPGGEIAMNSSRTLLDAFQKNDIEGVRRLLESDPGQAATRDARGGSLILSAIFAGRGEMAGLLAAARDDLDVFEAAALGRVERVRVLVEETPSRAAAFGADGFAALHYAAHLGFVEIAELLLDRGAEVAAASRNPLDVMPLQSAVAGGQVAIARMLLERGAPVNARQEKAGTTALHVAAFIGNAELVALLIEHGAEVNAAQTTDGKTPLAMALERGHAEVGEFLRRHGAE
jgi:ankyrin repeat protein